MRMSLSDFKIGTLQITPLLAKQGPRWMSSGGQLKEWEKEASSGFSPS